LAKVFRGKLLAALKQEGLTSVIVNLVVA